MVVLAALFAWHLLAAALVGLAWGWWQSARPAAAGARPALVTVLLALVAGFVATESGQIVGRPAFVIQMIVLFVGAYIAGCTAGFLARWVFASRVSADPSLPGR